MKKPIKKASLVDKKFIQKCIDLSKESIKDGDAPFGALVVKNGQIIAESGNNAAKRISDHAEILVLHQAWQKENKTKLSDCTLYSNCEPCPMCSFMIREYKIKKVVFSLESPFMGGYSKWNILGDKGLAQFKDYFGKIPEIIPGVLAKQAKEVFDKTPLWMFGKEAKKTKKK